VGQPARTWSSRSVTASRRWNELGTNPSVVALSPADAVELDLFTTGADDAYAFALRDSGSSSPLFGLRIVETAAVTNPLLIDPPALGLLYVGQAALEVDPYSGFKENVSTVRLEGNVLYHVRNPRARMRSAAAKKGET
jgi:hypothetical protein